MMEYFTLIVDWIFSGLRYYSTVGAGVAMAFSAHESAKMTAQKKCHERSLLDFLGVTVFWPYYLRRIARGEFV